MRKPLLLPAAAVSAVVLCAILAWMIADRASVLRNGTEIVLKTEPFDPRDLLRGQYVRLNYGISTLPGEMIAFEDDEAADAGDPVFVKVEQGEDGYYASVAAVLGEEPEPASGEIWLRGRMVYGIVPESVNAQVEYGIERFYAPETVAPEIEKRMRDGDVTEAVVAVAEDGRAQIKALRQPSGTLYTEPLF